MLVLARHKDETIQIGDDITIMVTRIKPHIAWLGILAPPELRISRGPKIPQHPDKSPPNWWEYKNNRNALVKWLNQCEPMSTDEVIAFYEDPSSYEAEWQLFQEASL